MGAGIVSFMLAIGVTAWVYQKFMSSTGNNTQTALIGSGVVGLVVFIIAYILFRSF